MNTVAGFAGGMELLRFSGKQPALIRRWTIIEHAVEAPGNPDSIKAVIGMGWGASNALR